MTTFSTGYMIFDRNNKKERCTKCNSSDIKVVKYSSGNIVITCNSCCEVYSKK